MVQIEKKYLSLGINADDAPFAVNGGDGGSELINAVNNQFGVSRDGKTGYNESVPGNSILTFTYPDGLQTAFGSARDEVRNRIFYFDYNENGNHGIYCVETNTNVTRKVLLSTQVRDGFGWNMNTRINEAHVIGDKLYWCDPEPRCLNIEAGLKYNDISYNTDTQPYAIGILQSTIRLIKKTQNLPVRIQKLSSANVPSLVGYTTNVLFDAYQFFVRYTYRDYERSVIGPFSRLAEYNYKDSPLNVIEIKFDLGDVFEQDVEIIELCVRYNNIGNGFVIKQWDRKNPQDNNEINSHNNGIPLKYYFLNTETGPAVDPKELSKPFDSIPLTALTQSVAKNRLFLGNGVYGYDTPAITSLTTAVTTFPSAGGLLGAWYKYTVTWTHTIAGGNSNVSMPAIFVDLGPTYAKRYVVFGDLNMDYVTSISSDVGTANPAFVFPTFISNARISLQAATLLEIDFFIANLRRNQATGTITNVANNTPTPANVQILITNNLTQGESRTFKSNSAIKSGIVFFDEDRRKCGVVTNDNLKNRFPNRSFEQISFTSVLSWTLSNSNALAEIPDWAHYYAIVRTKNLTTDFFFQGHGTDVQYVTRDADAKLVFGSSNFWSRGTWGLGIKITDMIALGIGYSYTENDLVNLYFQSPRIPAMGIKVKGQYADWIILDPVNIGSLGGVLPVVFDLFTPHKEATTEGYYEIGEIYQILNPETSSRQYSKTSGVLNGDVYAISRTAATFAYVAETMSPDDKHWKEWWTDIGWINIIDTIGQQPRRNSLSWSNVLIPGTRSNGLSSFDALDIYDLPVENGDLNKLILTSKVQDEGTVMLAICDNETSSMYLGETQVIDASGNVSFTATSTTVIGTVNTLKGSFGTQHAESVKEFRGSVYWWDVKNGAIVQYSSNGLFPVTNYKMVNFFRKYAIRYRESGATYPMIGGIDPYSEKYLLSLTGLESGSYANVLPTLTDINEFKMYDGKSKTFAFGLGRDKFMTTYPFYTELIEYMGIKYYGFKAGSAYQFNAPDSTNTPDNFFFGSQYTTKLMFLANSNPFKIKRFSNIVIEGNMAPVRCIFYTINEYNGAITYEQITDLVQSDFRNKEGNWYAALLRDRISPNSKGSADEKMFTGEKMMGKAMMCQIEFNTSTKKLQLQAVNIAYHISEGHTT